jgi:LuxR family maltose regulon positive regulatory protein
LPPRLRLIEKLNQGLRLGCTLTLISVPAGFGKTTLVTVWLTGLDHPRTWLSLDENDNDPARFFTYLVAALQGNDPSIGQTAQAMLQSPEPPLPETYPASLINDMAITSHSFLFVTMLCLGFDAWLRGCQNPSHGSAWMRLAKLLNGIPFGFQHHST